MLEIGRALEKSSTAVLEHGVRGLDLLSAPASFGITVVCQGERVVSSVSQTYRMFAGGSIDGMYSKTT